MSPASSGGPTISVRRGARVRHLRILAGLLLLGGAPARADVRIPGFELVHTAPVETRLATPDIRDAVAVWGAMIDHARATIDFGQFYVAAKAGEPLDLILAKMEAAGRRGVRMRFLMEEKGQSSSDPETIARLRAIPNLDFRMLDYSKVTGNGIIHAKYFIVDGRSAYVGSQNFDWRSLKHIDETGLRIDEPAMVGQLARIFAQDWQAQALVAAGQRVPPLGDGLQAVDDTRPAFLLASPGAFTPADVGNSELELPRLLAQAQREVRIEVMDYAPLDQQRGYYGVIDQAVRAAAQRGVKIKLMVADWNLTFTKLPYLKSLAVLPNIEVRVVTLPRAAAGFIPYARVVHTKTMAIDDAIAWIGTSNWEGGYLDKSRNLEVVLRNPLMAKRVAALHEQMWASPYAAPLDVMRAYPAPHPGSAEPPPPGAWSASHPATMPR